MRIRATVNITYEVKPENYVLILPGNRKAQILEFERILLSSKIAEIQHFSPFMFPHPVTDVKMEQL